MYSIRSWLYVSLHGVVGKIGSLLFNSEVHEFYAIRVSLAIVCAACQTRLYSAICRTLSPRIGLLFLMIVAFSPGMFHASASFLPSSFTMYTSMLGLTAFLDWRSSRKISQGIMWFGLGAIVGWPFAGALVTPFIMEELLNALLSGSLGTVIYSIAHGAVKCLTILVSACPSFTSTTILTYLPGCRGSCRLCFSQEAHRGPVEYRRLQYFRGSG